MAYEIPYHRHPNFRPVNDLMPGNAESEDPVEFDLAPAWGADLARIRSIITASLGLVQEQDWGPAIQAAVIASFDTGGAAFVNTIEAVRGLRIPAAMAVRAGLLVEMPKVAGTNKPDYDAKVAITTGLAFSRICGAVPAMAFHVATKIAEISQKAEGVVADSRFFAQPSGSGGTGTSAAPATTAGSARPTSRRRGTAGKPGRTAK